MNWNPFAIVQARLGSTRFPRKVFSMVRPGVPLLAMQVWRMAHSKELMGAVVAVPAGAENKDLVRFCRKNEIRCYRGPEDDVLKRYYLAAVKYGADPVVRVTADCPLIDYGIIDGAIRLYRESGADYVSNNLEQSFPHGTDVEVFSFAALKKAHQEATEAFDREHVTEYIRRHQDRPFTLVNMRAPLEQMDPQQAAVMVAARLTVDYPEDLRLVQEIFKAFPEANTYVTIADVVRMLYARPELMRINEHRAEEYFSRLEGRYEPISEQMLDAVRDEQARAARAAIRRIH